MTIDLSEYAVRLALHIVHVSEKGLSDPINWSTVADRFTPADRDHMVEAAYELKVAGLLRVSQALNVPDGISHIRAEYPLYWTFDGDVFNYDVSTDIVTLIRLILEDESRGDAATLIKCLDWSPRRFNPAFARVVEEFPEGRVRQVLQADFPSAGVLVMPEDRVNLRSLLTEIESASEPEPVENGTSEQQETLAVLPASKITFKLPFIEFESHAPRWFVWISVVAVFTIVVIWQWPAIDARIVAMTGKNDYSLLYWREDVGRNGRAEIRIKPNRERARDIEVYVRFVEIQESPGDPWHRLVVTLNGDQYKDTGQIGTTPGPSNIGEFRFAVSVAQNASLDIVAEVTNYRTRHEELVIEAVELN